MKRNFLLLLAMLFISACSGEKQDSVISNTAQITSLDWSVAITKGNHSYVPLVIDGKPHYHADMILQIIDEFEKKHPDLKIFDWKIEKQQDAHGVSPYIYGLWIDHEPKK